MALVKRLGRALGEGRRIWPGDGSDALGKAGTGDQTLIATKPSKSVYLQKCQRRPGLLETWGLEREDYGQSCSPGQRSRI